MPQHIDTYIERFEAVLQDIAYRKKDFDTEEARIAQEFINQIELQLTYLRDNLRELKHKEQWRINPKTQKVV